MRRLLVSMALVAVSAGTAAAQQMSLTRPRNIYVVAAPDPSAKPAAAPMHRVLFVNRNGGTYTPGSPSNASTNVTGLVTEPRTVPPFHLNDAAWAAVMECITLMYERFSITVTDVDPGDTPHMEDVVGGLPSDIGQSSEVGGVGEYPSICGGVNERGISFTFSRVWGTNIQDICDTIAQESAHVMGLDHEFLCEDPMTYLFGCGPKTFQDVDAPCGEDGPRPCRCGTGGTQNSVQVLYGLLGYADPIPPEVSITAPLDGAVVAPGFTVTAAPIDNGRVARVELWVDGQYTDVFAAAEPWELVAPVGLAFGSHMVDVHAIDGGTNMATATIMVDVQPECTTDADCDSTEDCADNRCSPGLGQPCEMHTDCASLTCSRNPDNVRVCSTACGAEDSCPEGFVCEAATQLCFAGAEGGGGCVTTRGGGTSTGGRAGGIAAIVIGLALAFGLRRRGTGSHPPTHRRN